MKNFNIVRLDSKGRIIVPFHIRDYIGLKEGMELIIVNNEKRELRIFPLVNGNTAHLRLMMSDAQGSLSKVMNLMS
ncbi:MAG: AbrB family transcriptional regulator, partial [Candidatus Aenigmarchaeota archaeon]|nr:AbrB family transcriptional regulator [Candidatus Aenigmarchaeota archaeon]